MSLRKEPSFSVFNDPFSEARQEESEEAIGENTEFSFAKGSMGLIEEDDIEEVEMVEQSPFHPLLLRKYAQILQRKGDVVGVENGELWMECAQLTWNLHGDKDQASAYFKLATQVAPNHSNILAAYARFLWEIDEEEEEENDDAFILQNYDNLLYQIKGDLEEAESYYSRAMVADPEDGELTARYAKHVWDLRRDRHKASVFFERALQASSDNSNVLAAYAGFLWETEDSEDETVQHSSSGEQMPANL